MRLLITGGSKCGKSTLAEGLACRLAGGSPVVYLATMQVTGPEEKAIVARHARQRAGKGFLVLEQAWDLGSILLPEEAVLLLEDVPNALANEMFGGRGPEAAYAGIASLLPRCRHLVMVTNEVGSDGADYLSDTLAFIDALGRLNRRLAALADTVVEVVAGLPLILKGRMP